jgi:hypothetical protein
VLYSVSNFFGIIQHITDKRTIYNFIRKIIYYRQNVIDNSIGELTIAMSIAVIIFQLLDIYQQTYSIGELTVAIVFAELFFQLSGIY